MAIPFNDKKEIYFLSAIHKANVDTRKRDPQGNVVRKLKLIEDYNRYMGGVDKNDEMICTYSSIRKSMKWTKKVAFHFIEEGILNAYILFKKEGGTKPLLRFKLDCINYLLASSASEPSAPEASDPFSCWHLQNSSLPQTANRILRRDVWCVPATTKGKRADTSVGTVHTNQVFVQHLASGFTSHNETEHCFVNFYFT